MFTYGLGVFISVLFFVYSSSLYAANFVASVTSGSYSNNTVTVSGFVNYNPGGVGVPTSSSGDVCHGSNQCYYGPVAAYRYIAAGYTFTTINVINNNSSVEAFKSDDKAPTSSYTYLADALRNKYGTIMSVNSTMPTVSFGSTRQLLDVGICMASSVNDAQQTSRSYDSTSCSWIKPTISCNVQNSVVLDHGNLQLGSVNGNKKNNTVKVSCSGALSAKLFLLPDTINLAPGLVSKITVNGKSTEQTIPLRAGDNNITVESTLVDSGAKAGAFQGSTTLVVSFQ